MAGKPRRRLSPAPPQGSAEGTPPLGEGLRRWLCRGGFGAHKPPVGLGEGAVSWDIPFALPLKVVSVWPALFARGGRAGAGVGISRFLQHVQEFELKGLTAEQCLLGNRTRGKKKTFIRLLWDMGIKDKANKNMQTNPNFSP